MTYEKNKFLLRIISLIDNNNNIKPTTLDFLRPFVNLENLSLNSYVNLKQLEGSYNQFYGSLKPLENLSKLKELNISNTDIDSGLEFLSESIEIFRCSTDYYKAKSYKQKLQYESQELKTQLMELKQKKEDSDRNLLNLEMIAEIYYQYKLNLQEQLDQSEARNQELKLLSAKQIREFAEKESTFQIQIDFLQNENHTLVGSLAIQLKQNKLTNKQVQSQIGKLKKDKLELQEKLIKSAACIQKLKSQKANLIKQKDSLEDKLNQSQTTY
ncbi:kinase-like domain-containing protein [Rhizophagus irregularis DAOM 181602=DAOM 197198]|nr:kinase-like domain-containing protein [Rhizophagus irregularis DAOM 181602=DAOM 197198]